MRAGVPHVIVGVVRTTAATVTVAVPVADPTAFIAVSV
jgi:hypothetical protein